MIKRIAHIGIAVADLEKAVRTFAGVLGMPDEGREQLEDRDLKTAFLRAGESHVELIESLGEDTPIAKYLRKRGEGIHHICFEVDDLDGALRRCRAAGIEVIGDGGEAGAQGKRVAFLHPRSTHGVLIELSEPTTRRIP
jgi:methylmalonyl-CoA/ethylmalonyl-CoA epimerase